MRWFLIFLVCAALGAQERPPIVGVANIRLKTDNMAAARGFYGHMLGYQELFAGCFRVNDHQYIEVSPELKSETEDRLSHIAFETTNLQQLRDYLVHHRVQVSDGDSSLMLKDPDGHNVEFVEYRPGSQYTRNFGKFLPDTRISERIIHVGVTVQDRAAADRFYKDILGFHEIWHGGMQDNTTDWADMQVPDGTDWLEYMLNVRNPSPRTLGVMHHLALGVPSVKAGYRTVTQRGLKAEKPQIGRDGKWQLNLYDRNGTRTELMEPKPVRKPCCSPIESHP